MLKYIFCYNIVHMHGIVKFCSLVLSHVLQAVKGCPLFRTCYNVLGCWDVEFNKEKFKLAEGIV